jgi:TM2 domain-containing membrane protein YozV
MMMMLPGMTPEEMIMIQSLTKDWDNNKKQQFFSLYATKRKEAQQILLLTLVGFLGLAGIHRIVLGQVGMGVLYLFTGGLCCIGTIVDLVNNATLTSEFNQKMAIESAHMVKMASS